MIDRKYAEHLWIIGAELVNYPEIMQLTDKYSMSYPYFGEMGFEKVVTNPTNLGSNFIQAVKR